MKNLINVKSIALGAAVFLTLSSAISSSAQENNNRETNVAEYMNTNRIIGLAASSLNSRGEGMRAMGDAGGIKSITVDDTPNQPYVVQIATKNNCLITITFKQQPEVTKDLVNFSVAEKTVECEK